MGQTTYPSCCHSGLSKIKAISFFAYSFDAREGETNYIPLLLSQLKAKIKAINSYVHVFGLGVKMGQTHFEIWDKIHLLQHT